MNTGVKYIIGLGLILCPTMSSLSANDKRAEDVLQAIEADRKEEKKNLKAQAEQLKADLLDEKNQENQLIKSLEGKVDSAQKRVSEAKKGDQEFDHEFGSLIEDQNKSLETLVKEQKAELENQNKQNKIDEEWLRQEIEASQRRQSRLISLSKLMGEVVDEMLLKRVNMAGDQQNRVTKTRDLLVEVEAQKESLGKMRQVIALNREKARGLLDKNREIEKSNRKRLNNKLTQLVQELPRFSEEAELMIKEQDKFETVVQEKVTVLTEKYNLGLEQQADLTRLISAELSKLFGMVKANSDAIELDKKLGVYLDRINVKGRKNKNYMNKLSTFGELMANRNTQTDQQMGALQQQVTELARIAQAERLRQLTIIDSQRAELEQLKRRVTVSSSGEDWILAEGFGKSVSEKPAAPDTISLIEKQATQLGEMKATFGKKYPHLKQSFLRDYEVKANNSQKGTPENASQNNTLEWQKVPW